MKKTKAKAKEASVTRRAARFVALKTDEKEFRDLCGGQTSIMHAEFTRALDDVLAMATVPDAPAPWDSSRTTRMTRRLRPDQWEKVDAKKLPRGWESHIYRASLKLALHRLRVAKGAA